MNTATECSIRTPITLTRKDITVNGVAISRKAIAQEVQNHVASKPVFAWQAAARALVIKELLLQEAKLLKINPQPLADEQGRRETNEEALMRGLIEDQIKIPSVSEENCRIYFENNRSRFKSKTIWVAAHILFKVDARDQQTFSQIRNKAEMVLATLKKDPSLFGVLAREHSDCPSAAQNGLLGQIMQGETTKSFEMALENLEAGMLSATPVETPYGLHIIRLDRKIDGAILDYIQVRDKIAAYLTESVQRKSQAQYIKILAGRAKITGIDFEANPGMLVQ